MLPLTCWNRMNHRSGSRFASAYKMPRRATSVTCENRYALHPGLQRCASNARRTAPSIAHLYGAKWYGAHRVLVNASELGHSTATKR